MRIIENIVYYTVGDIASICNRQWQTIYGWIRHSNALEEQGKEGFMPKPKIVNSRRLYTKPQADQILIFSRNIKRGQLSEYSRSRWGLRGKEIAERMKEKKFKELKESLDKVNKAVDYKERFKRLKSKVK